MLREFTDTLGVTWRVWDVNPVVHNRDSKALRRAFLTVPDGWLCFESEKGRRRLAPIPADWDVTDTLNLEYYCSRAEEVDKPGSNYMQSREPGAGSGESS